MFDSVLPECAWLRSKCIEVSVNSLLCVISCAVMIRTYFWLNIRSKVYSGVWQLKSLQRLGYWAEQPNYYALRSDSVEGVFSFAKCPDWPWCLPILIFNDYQYIGDFPYGESAFSAKIKNERSQASATSICLQGVNRNNFTCIYQWRNCDHELADSPCHTTVVDCWWNYYWRAKSNVPREILVPNSTSK